MIQLDIVLDSVRPIDRQRSLGAELVLVKENGPMHIELYACPEPIKFF